MTSEAPDKKSMTSEESENVCVGGHNWEEGNGPTHACKNGVFTGRKRLNCRVRFADRKIFKEGESTWKIGVGLMLAHHGMICNICACSKC
jgi:hypothetical protein